MPAIGVSYIDDLQIFQLPDPHNFIHITVQGMMPFQGKFKFCSAVQQVVPGARPVLWAPVHVRAWRTQL